MKKRLLMTLILSGGLVLTSCGANPGSTITAVKLNRSYISLSIDETFLLEATTIGGEKEVTFFSADSSIASIDENGLVRAIASGETSVYAIANDKIATCLVKVENHDNDIKSAIKHGTISMKIDSSFFAKTGQVFNAPLTYTYQSRGGAFDDENSKMHFDVNWTKGVSSKDYTEEEQAEINVDFINYLFNMNNTSATSLFSPKKGWEERALGYVFKRKSETKNYGEDHFTIAMLNDRLYADSYAVIDDNLYPRASQEFVYEDNEIIEVISTLLKTIRMLDLSKLSLSQLDLVTILKNMYPDPATILDEDTNQGIQSVLRGFAIILFALSGYTNIDYKPLTIKGYDGINLHFYLNELGKENLASLSSLFGNLSIEGYEEIKEVLKDIAINDFALDLNIYSDPLYKNYNHVSSLSILLDLNLPNDNTFKFDTTVDFGVETTYEKASYISSLYDNHNMNKIIQKEADDYIATIGDVISYNDNDKGSTDFSIESDELAKSKEALKNFSKLSSKARFMIVEEKFNASEIENLYLLGETALNVSKAAMVLINENSSMSSIKAVVQPVKNYRDFKEALNEANESKFIVMSNIVRNYLNNVKTLIEESALGLKEASNLNTDDEIINNALLYQDIYDQNGPVFSLIKRRIIGIEIEPTYGDDVMLTDELIELRNEIISTEEVRDENDNLINNLFAVKKYTLDAFKNAINFIIENNDDELLYEKISYLDDDRSDTNLALFARMAKREFKSSYFPSQVGLNTLLNAEQSIKLIALFQTKANGLKDEIYETLIDYKTNVIDEDTANEKLDLIEINLDNIELIQNDLLDTLGRVNLANIRGILNDARNLII